MNDNTGMRADALENESLWPQIESAFTGSQDATVIHTHDTAYVLEQIDCYAQKEKENLIVWKDCHFRPNRFRRSSRTPRGIHQYRNFTEDPQERTTFCAALEELSTIRGCESAFAWFRDTPLDSFVFCIEADELEDINDGMMMLYLKGNGMKKASRLILLVDDEGDIGMSEVFGTTIKHVIFEQPGIEDIKRICEEEYRRIHDDSLPESLSSVLSCLKGMSSSEIRKEIRKLCEEGELDADMLRNRFMKHKLGNLETGAVEYEEITEQPSCGGLDILKKWIDGRSALLTDRAKAFGLEAPKGVLLLGPPGTGKSLAARNIAWVMHLPLLNFRVSGIFSCWVGGTEKNADRMFKVLDEVGPCVLFIDEVEKLFAGAGSGGRGHETAKRFLSQLLTWMNDRKSEVFVVAASNWLTEVPVEMTRAGRFDSIFYVGLPGDAARREILDIHLAKRHQDLPDIPDEVVQKTAGYSGAELAEVVKNACLSAFQRGADAVSAEDLLQAIPTVQPLAQTRADDIAKMAAIGHQLGLAASSEEYTLPSPVKPAEDWSYV